MDEVKTGIEPLTAEDVAFMRDVARSCFDPQFEPGRSPDFDFGYPNSREDVKALERFKAACDTLLRSEDLMARHLSPMDKSVLDWLKKMSGFTKRLLNDDSAVIGSRAATLRANIGFIVLLQGCWHKRGGGLRDDGTRERGIYPDRHKDGGYGGELLSLAYKVLEHTEIPKSRWPTPRQFEHALNKQEEHMKTVASASTNDE